MNAISIHSPPDPAAQRAALAAARGALDADGPIATTARLLLSDQVAPLPGDWCEAEIDGSRNAAGALFTGILVYDASGALVARECAHVGIGQAFEAEARALLLAVRRARCHGAAGVRVYTDCLTLVQALDAESRREHPLVNKIRRVLIGTGLRLELIWVPRAFNSAADHLASQRH